MSLPAPKENPATPTSGPFLWGVATSAYQSEGGYNGTGQPQTNWSAVEQSGDVAELGAAADFWTRYEDDFARCQSMGLNAFRIGIEWSRIQPTTTLNSYEVPDFDVTALEHYARMLVSCRAHGMEPVVTLHHFVHPSWLGTDPWLDEATPAIFQTYVTRLVTSLNQELVSRHQAEPLKYFITINEPNMLVLNTYLGQQFPGSGPVGMESVITAYNQLLIAHINAYNAIHDLYEKAGWPAPLVTFNNYCSDLYWSDKVLLDLVSCREAGIERADIQSYIRHRCTLFGDAFHAAKIPLRKNISYWIGSFIKHISNTLGWRIFSPDRFTPLLDAIYASPRARLFDYVGLDYYDPFAAHVFRLPSFSDGEFKTKTFRAWIMNSVTSKWWDWRVLPEGLHFFCSLYTKEYQRPLLIAENGMALRRRFDNVATFRRDRMLRSQFLKAHVREVMNIVSEGIPLIGYLHWSLFDNYEWGSYTPRFGLFALDYSHNLERQVEDHYGDKPSVVYAELIATARQQNNSPAFGS